MPWGPSVRLSVQLSVRLQCASGGWKLDAEEPRLHAVPGNSRVPAACTGGVPDRVPESEKASAYYSLENMHFHLAFSVHLNLW